MFKPLRFMEIYLLKIFRLFVVFSSQLRITYCYEARRGFLQSLRGPNKLLGPVLSHILHCKHYLATVQS